MKKILLLCNKTKNIAATVNDHVTSFKKYSKFNFDILDCLTEKPTMALLETYDALVIHYSLWIELDYNLSPLTRFLISHYSGPKIIFMQDENRNVNKLLSCLRALGVNIIFSCVPEAEIHKVYTQDNLPGVKVISTKTGFVPQELLSLDLPSYSERPLDVVYRARKLSAWYGRLCYEKYTIADRFLADANNYNLKVDISALESDRIHGEAWVKFLLSSKAALGVESGASLFDFTGNIRENVEKHELLNPNTPFEELENLYFKGLDYNVNYNQISPRHFEAAALKTLMILYEGEYSQILEPWQHYVPLKKDHSNIEEVVSALRDEKVWQRITDNAYQEIGLNKQFTYQSFIAKFDEQISAYFNSQGIVTRTPAESPQIILNQQDQGQLQQQDQQNQNQQMQTQRNQHSDKSGIVYKIAQAKNLLRRVVAKIYWRIDGWCNASNTENWAAKLSSKLLRTVKNSLKLVDIKFRNHDKSNNKFIILINHLYYKKLFNKNFLFSSEHGNHSLFCMLPERHQGLEVDKQIKKSTKFNIFKKTVVCNDCKWFIGL